MYDCLNGIFQVVTTKKDHIVQSLQDSVQSKMLGRKFPRAIKDIDPFELYQGYVDKVKPVDYHLQVSNYEEEIESLRDQLKRALLQVQ